MRASVCFVALAITACSRPGTEREKSSPPPSATVIVATEAPTMSAKIVEDIAPIVSAAPSAPMATSAPSGSASGMYATSQEDLLALFAIRTPTEKERKKHGDPALLLDKTFGLGTPTKMNQGNPDIARHAFTREQCLAGLSGIDIQTPEQRKICGADRMVPLYRHGKMDDAKTCIDVFEFPNQPCELPIVWASPTQASAICELQGKRLCAQEEWTLACRGDPEGKTESRYAYGEDLDLAICNTNKPAASFGEPACEPGSASSAWKTCRTNTEPTGSYPKCRSRFGVFDLHGNVAEIQTRLDEDGKVYSQLRGSAFFYVDVARRPDERPKEGRETYPDTCSYDPRWHVEPIESAWHVNYHLGFRCCKTVR